MEICSTRGVSCRTSPIATISCRDLYNQKQGQSLFVRDAATHHLDALGLAVLGRDLGEGVREGFFVESIAGEHLTS